MRTKVFIPSVESYVGTESIVDYNLGNNSFENKYSPLTKIKLHLVALSVLNNSFQNIRFKHYLIFL